MWPCPCSAAQPAPGLASSSPAFSQQSWWPLSGCFQVTNDHPLPPPTSLALGLPPAWPLLCNTRFRAGVTEPCVGLNQDLAPKKGGSAGIGMQEPHRVGTCFASAAGVLSELRLTPHGLGKQEWEG